MADPDSSVRVADNPDRARYEAYVGDELAGVVTYRIRPGVVVALHTEVDPRFEGHRVGSRLAWVVLEDARAKGLRIDPVCPFIAGYIERHPQFAGRVAGPGSPSGS